MAPDLEAGIAGQAGRHTRAVRNNLFAICERGPVPGQIHALRGRPLKAKGFGADGAKDGPARPEAVSDRHHEDVYMLHLPERAARFFPCGGSHFNSGGKWSDPVRAHGNHRDRRTGKFLERVDIILGLFGQPTGICGTFQCCLQIRQNSS